MEAHVSNTAVSADNWSPAPDASPIVSGIHAMLHPRNIVLVGATDKPGNMPSALEQSHQVQVSRRALPYQCTQIDVVWGVTCYKDFACLPEKPDHVLVLVPARFVAQVVRDAAAAGARSATIVTSGSASCRTRRVSSLPPNSTSRCVRKELQ
ncbi:CoA-binding protein [Bradyrhizobium sp. CCBAU 25360]|uniref:CoA-binding protein n=1 Tax=Bradyrhizobium sp. CCBAU 25360 TaxID=858425 RepID=UPI003FA4BB55